MATEVKKPSWIPPATSLIAIVTSLIIYFIEPLKNSPMIYIGYFLTPFAPILSLAIARSNDTKARSNVFYDLAKGKQIVSISVGLSLVGFLVSVFVIYEIASGLSQI